jgi:hypothetical protein
MGNVMRTNQFRGVLISFLIIIVAALACNKDSDRIIIDGSVTDPVQLMKVQGANVSLYGKLFQGGVFHPDPSVIAMATTDASGNFKIDVGQVKASDFEIHVQKDDYFGFTEPLTTNEIAAGKTYTPAYQIYPQAWIHLKVRNTFPYNASDLISYRILSQNPSCADCCSDAYVQGAGTNYNKEVFCRSRALSSAKILWNVHKGGNSFTDSAILILPLFDTAYYELNY